MVRRIRASYLTESKRDDTFRRVFERIDTEAFEQSLGKWVQQLIPGLEREIVPIDGKSLRGSYDRNQGIKALHLVTAWAAQHCLTRLTD